MIRFSRVDAVVVVFELRKGGTVRCLIHQVPTSLQGDDLGLVSEVVFVLDGFALTLVSNRFKNHSKRLLTGRTAR